MANSLTYFGVTGNYAAVADPSISGDLNSPVLQVVSGLVTFTPRLPKGQMFYVEDLLITEAYNARQTVNLLGIPIGGTWLLSFLGHQTTALPWDATPQQVESALEALPGIGAGNVNVIADVEPQAYDVEFTNALGLQGMPVLVGVADLLVNSEGAGFCEITVDATALGSPELVANTAVALPPLTARIWNGVLSTIDRVDTPGFQLTANTAILGLDDDLIYDVSYSSVTFNGDSQYLAPFGFIAPAEPDITMCITDPSMKRVAYDTPDETIWTPPGQASEVFGTYDTKLQRAPHGQPTVVPMRSNWRTAGRQRTG